jgi:nucleoside 2-deoxyribosyltransferase
MRIYLAGPFFTEEARLSMHRAVGAIQSAITTAELFNPEHASRDIWAGRRPQEANSEDREKVLHQNVRGILSADLVVAYLRGTGGPFTDQGTVWELGFAHAHGHRPIGFWDPQFDEINSLNLMVAETLAGVVTIAQLEGAIRGWAQHGWEWTKVNFPGPAMMEIV